MTVLPTISASTALSALIGGALIGCAAALMLLYNGRLAGVAGIARGLISNQAGDVAWRIAFILGLASGAGVLMHVLPDAFDYRTLPSATVLVSGGLLVGFGSSLARGCTSGHGVCGVSRLSKRSLVATVTFMATAMLTVFIVRHGVGSAP